VARQLRALVDMDHRQFIRATVALAGLLGSACTSDGDAGGVAASCSSAQDLSGASYDLSKSRFAFGSSPVREDASGLIRWVGTQGVIGLAPNGGMMAVENGDSPALLRPTFSFDEDTVTAHVLAYFEGMGVLDCQVQGVALFASFVGKSVCQSPLPRTERS
jgi:hypothetical protein